MYCSHCYHSDVCFLHIIYDVKKCKFFIDKTQIIELPMEATNALRCELSSYCYDRCIDEL